MTVAELIPTIQGLSHTEKLLLLQVLVQELLNADSAANLSAADSEAPVEVAYISEPTPPTLTLAERRAFLKQPLAERQRLLAAQATELQDHYHQTTDWQDLMAGDIIEY